MKRGVLIIFVAILIPCLLQAQTTPNDPQRLTLEQAVNFAVEHNKELQASQMNIELRNKMVTEAISQGLPQINGDLNYSTNFRYKMSFPGLPLTNCYSVVNGYWEYKPVRLLN